MRGFIIFLVTAFGLFVIWEVVSQMFSGNGFFTTANAAPVLNVKSTSLRAPTPPNIGSPVPVAPNPIFYAARAPLPPSTIGALPLSLPEGINSGNLFAGGTDLPATAGEQFYA